MLRFAGKSNAVECSLQMAGVTCKGSELDSISAAQQFLLQHCKVCNGSASVLCININ